METMSTRNPPLLSVVVPAFNEADVIGETVNALVKALSEIDESWEIIVVDDGSTDATTPAVLELIGHENRLRLITLSRNFGHQNAICAGLDLAIGAYVAVIDADLQDPPEALVGMIRKAMEGYDVVYGVRRSRKEGLLKRSAYWSYYRILRALSDEAIHLDAGDFSVMSRTVVDHINSLPEKNRYVRGLRHWVGFRQVDYEYDRHSRKAGSPKYDLRKLANLAETGVLSSSKIPLKLSIYVGSVLALGGFAWAFKVLFVRIFYNTAPEGFSALMVALLVIGGMQLIAIGVVGSYLGRVLTQVESRPVYIVAQKHNFED